VKLGIPNLVDRFIVADPSLSVTNRPLKGHGQAHVTNFTILHPTKYLMAKATDRLQILCTVWSREVLTCHVTQSRISHPLKCLWNSWSYSCQILSACRLYQVLAFRRLTIPQRGMAWMTRSFLEFYTPLNFSGMAEDRIVKFCARVDPRRISLVMTNCPQVGVVKVTW